MKKNFTLLLMLIFSTVLAQNGKLISKRLVRLQDVPVWAGICESDSLKPEFAHLGKLNFYFIKYESDGLQVNGIVVAPKKPGIYPVIIFNRGGNRSFGSLTIQHMIAYTAKLAAEGFVIIASNYREKDEFGGSDINDVLYLTETVNEIEFADAQNIGMFGWSRGGMMTYLALAKSRKIKTAVISNGPTDLIGLLKDRPEMESEVYRQCIPGYDANKEFELKKRSVVFWPEKLDKQSSLLILCGTNDDKVNPHHAEEIARKLTQIRYDFEIRRFDTDHTFSDKMNEMNATIAAWFIRKLKK